MFRFAVVFCLSSIPAVVAAEPSRDESGVIVTASRVEEPVSDTLWSSTVLTRSDIDARQAASVQELLADVGGIDIVNNGGLGKVSTVLLRGAEADQTLLLVDGVRVASATAGTAPFELIPVEQIERIEIVRGPRSTLYGTDAIGGVIQIFTRGAAERDGISLGGGVTGGSHDMRKVEANFQARGGRAWLSAGGGLLDTNGFNACASEALAAAAACFTDEPDLDGYRTTSGSVAFGYAFNDAWQGELRALASEGRTEFDGSFSNSADFSERVFAMSVQGALADGWRTRILLSRNVDDQQNFLDRTPTAVFDTTRDGASVQLDGRLNSALRLITGVEYQRDKVGGDTAYLRNSRDSAGLFGELHGEWLGWSALAGARYEDNQQFGGHVTGNVGLGHKLGSRHRVTALWGTAFHAPSFNDLYYPFGFGNPDLEPEESRSLEIGVDGTVALPVTARQTASLRWSLHAFQTDVEQLIAFDPVQFIPLNLAKSRIRGVEGRAGWHSDAWKLDMQLTRLDPVNRSDGDLLLPRRAEESVLVELQRLWPAMSARVAARYEGDRFDDLANTRRLGGFFTLDLATEYRIGRQLTAQARVANLFDREYHTAAYYFQDGRNYSVTLRYRFSDE